MTTRIEEFEELSRELAEKSHRLAQHKLTVTGSPGEICAVWAIAKPFVEVAIKLLNLLPFQWAKDLAIGLQALDDLMTKLCQG